MKGSLFLLLYLVSICGCANSAFFNADSLALLVDNDKYNDARKYLLTFNDDSKTWPDSENVEYLIQLGKVSTIVQEEGNLFEIYTIRL